MEGKEKEIIIKVKKSEKEIQIEKNLIEALYILASINQEPRHSKA